MGGRDDDGRGVQRSAAEAGGEDGDLEVALGNIDRVATHDASTEGILVEGGEGLRHEHRGQSQSNNRNELHLGTL